MCFLLIIPAEATYINKTDILISGDFSINNDIIKTNSINVSLNMNITGASQMRFGNTISERDSAAWEPYSSSKIWNLNSGEGKKTVYASFRNISLETVNVQDDIIFKIDPIIPYTSGLTLWFDAKDNSSINESSGKISQWNDKSGNNYHAIQDTASEQPNLLTNEIDFNGTSEYFYIQDINYVNSAPLDGLLVCGVFRTNHTSSSYNDNWSILDFDRSEWFNFYNKGGDYGFSYDSDGTIRDITTSGVGINNNSWHVACASYDNSITNDTIISINGNIEYSGNVEPNGAQIGASQLRRYGFIGDGSEAGAQDASRNGIYFDGGIGELIYFDSAVSSTDRKNLECYLGNKWSINITGCPADTIEPIASIEYSPETTTTGYVNAKLSNSSEEITITNNSGNDNYIFFNNGSFNFEYIDNNGTTGSTLATVDWINSNGLPPIASGSLNLAPEITSFSGASIVDINIASGAIDITTVSAIDNSYNVIGEFGKTTLSGNSWTNIGHYEICSPITTISHRGNVNGEIQRAPRVRNKTGTGFQVKVDNYNSSIGSLNTDIDYIVFNSGSYDLSGLKIQAGSALVSTVACSSNSSPGTATNVTFSPAFNTAPSVLHTVSSENDSSWVVSGVNANDGTRQSEPTTTTMGMIMQRSFNSCIHSPENIDYIAFEPGHYKTTLGFEIDAVRSTDSIAAVSSIGYPINYYSPFSSAPGVALVSQLGEDGGNGGYGQVHIGGGVLDKQLYATVDEDGPNADRSHTNEIFSSVTFSNNSGQFVEENNLTYSINSGNDASDFIINPSSGELRFITAQDPGNPTDSNLDGIYEVTISVCDSHCNSKCSYQSFNVNLSDTNPPIIYGSNFSSGTILPGGNHNIIFNYSDDAIGIDTNSDSIILQKWNGSIWGNDISSISFGTGIITQTGATYPSLNLDYGKYKATFNISDNNGNTSNNYEFIFYIDKPEIMVSTGSTDIGVLNSSSNSFSPDITITVKTVGAAFNVKLKRNQKLTSPGVTLDYYECGFDKNNDGNLTPVGTSEIIAQEVSNINTDGNLNTYSYTIKVGAIIDSQQPNGNYEAKIDFDLELNY